MSLSRMTTCLFSFLRQQDTGLDGCGFWGPTALWIASKFNYHVIQNQAYLHNIVRYKKNLKALYVVHLTRTYRIIFDLANKIISPKFARKLRYIPSLEVLKTNITLAPQFIPQRVIHYDSQLPAMSNTQAHGPPIPQRQKRPLPSLAFGRRLEDLASLEGIESTDYIPNFVIQIVNHLQDHGTIITTARHMWCLHVNRIGEGRHFQKVAF